MYVLFFFFKGAMASVKMDNKILFNKKTLEIA